MRPADLVPLLLPLLPPGPVGSPDADVITAIREAGLDGSRVADPAEAADAPLAAFLLLGGEVPAAGIRGPSLVAAAVAAVRPGGRIAIAGPSAVRALLAGDGTTGDRTTGDGAERVGAGFGGSAAAHLLAERGVSVDLLAGVGAAAAIGGRPWRGAGDLEVDRTVGLVDAGEVVLASGTTPRTSEERSATFFTSIARKVVAASVVCVDADGRILLVDDLFRGAWTLPGGLVDADESPDDAAAREALEEGGVVVDLGPLLGVFSHPHPDRVHLVYAATQRTPTPAPVPIHQHEIGASRWCTRAEAEAILPPDMRRKVALCLDRPGGTWRW